ncbi:hypothetical protein B0T18DRAFT_443462 [Schizothecium vesticola]|uniref:Uncharacterized protein n=1 Tax=Schizothecium vesticola TaxID=314040 RepID=A0AA40K984_9PEZI|nr:hypothetical protein B0T18DRAFT_443462 [Schizothecium vesticola]
MITATKTRHLLALFFPTKPTTTTKSNSLADPPPSKQILLHSLQNPTNITTMMRTKAVSSLSPLWRAPLATRTAIRYPTVAYQQRRGLANDNSDLGGVDGSEPPSPQKNKHNWIAGSITITAVAFIGWRMMVAKKKQAADRAA